MDKRGNICLSDDVREAMVFISLWTKNICPPRSISRFTAFLMIFLSKDIISVNIGNRSLGGVLISEKSLAPIKEK